MAKKEEPKVVRTFEEAVSAFQEEESLALDLETSGFSPWNDVAHVIALYGEKSHTIAILHYPKGVKIPQEVLDWLSNFPELVMHNGVQFDALFLAAAGMQWDRPKLYDTLIGELSVLQVDRRDVRVNLQDTVKRRLGKTIDKTIAHGRWGNLELDEEQIAYVTGDIQFLLEMRKKQEKEARDREEKEVKRKQAKTIDCINFEMELTKPVIRMSLNGLPIDLDALEVYFQQRAETFLRNDSFLHEQLGEHVLLTSNPQLMNALAERFGEGVFQNTQAETLLDFEKQGGEIGELCGVLLEWRNYRQRQNMFGPEWRTKYVVRHGDHFRVHGKFWQIGTNTGRFSSSEPNLQQVPKDMRGVYGGVPGLAIGKSDYSAIEVRVAAALSEDKAMIAAFNNGEDIHRVVAAAGFNKEYKDVTAEERQIAKAMSFTLLFGGGVETFRAYAHNHGAEISSEAASKAVENFFARFPGIERMRSRAIEQAYARKPITLSYPTGLHRLVRGEELRPTTLLNNSVQGHAAAGIKKALIEAEQAGISRYLSAVVHDEVVYTAPVDEIEEIRGEMDQCLIRGMQWALQGASDISIGVESSWGSTWKTNPETVVATESLLPS